MAYDCDDSDGVAKGILRLKDEPEYCSQLADNAQKYGKAVYARTVNTKLYEDLYRRIGGKE